MTDTGIGAPPYPPMRQCCNASALKLGSNKQRLYIAGTIRVWVMRSWVANSKNCLALNSCMIKIAPPTCTMVAMMAIKPVTWLAGTANIDESFSVKRIPYW